MAFQAGQAYIQVVPSLSGWNQQVRRQLKKELAGIKASVPIEGDFDGVKREAPKKGAEAAGEFARSFKARVQAALKSLPDVKVDADASPAQREIAGIRRELLELSGKSIGVDIDATAASAEVQRLQARLDELSRQDVSPDLRVDASAASAELARFRSNLDRLDGDTADVDVDADTAEAAAQLGVMSRLVSSLDGRRANVGVDVDGNALRSSLFLTQQVNGLVLAGGAIAPVFVPAFAAATAGAVGLAGAVAAAGAGVGALVAVSIPAFSAVSEAVKATEQAEKAAATSAISTTRQRAQAAYQAEQAAARVADAQRQASRTAVEGARRVQDAQQALADAQQRADSTAVEGARRVQDAQRALADTRRDVADRIDAANERVAASERQLERSHEAVQRAQEDLTRARRDAIRTLDDLRERSSDLALSEEGAEIALIEARQRLNKVNADAASTTLDRRKAALEVAEAEDRLSDVQRDRGRTAAELRDAERKGVSGADQVIAANERLRDASQAAADAQRGNASAQRDLARAQSDGARSIADAEQEVADARSDAAQAYADAARSIVAAEQNVAEARREGAEANADAARAVADAVRAQAQQAEMAALQAEQGTAGARNLAYALGELTGPQKALYDGWLRLRDAFTAWSRSLEPAVLPLFLGGMRLVERLLPRLTPLVLASAGAFENLLDRASKALESPFWQSFFDFLARTAGPAIEGFGRILGNLAGGFAGVLMAFEPFAMDMTGGLVELTEKFSEWGKGLGDSEGFQRFVEYVQAVWPPLKETLRAVSDAFGAIVEALAPLGGGPILTIVRTVAELIAGMDPGTIAAVAGGIAAFAGALKGWGIATAILSAGFGGGIFLVIVAAIAGLVGWLVQGYQTSEEFRDRVDRAIAPLKDTFDRVVETGKRLWEDVIQPLIPEVARFAEAAGGLAAALVNLGLPVLAAAFSGVGWVLRELVLPPLTAIVDFLAENEHVLIGVLAGFASVVLISLVPAFVAWAINAGIAAVNTLLMMAPIILVVAAIAALVAGVIWAYQNLGWFRTAVDAVGDAFQWFYREVVVPVWNGIGAAVAWAWDVVIKPALNALVGFITGTVVPILMWLWQNVVLPVWAGIQAAISFAWHMVIKPIFQAVWDFITNTLAPKFTWLWNDVIKPVWEKISYGISSFWHNVIKPVWDAILTFIDQKLMPKFTQLKDWVVGVMESMGTVLGGIWDGVVETIRTAVNAAITVINAIIRGINWVADKLGINIEIREIGQVGRPSKANSRPASRGSSGARAGGAQLAAGGAAPVWPGGSGWVRHPRAIVGEGDPLHPELVIATDPKYRHRNLGLWAEAGGRLGVPGFADGGHLPGDDQHHDPRMTTWVEAIPRFARGGELPRGAVGRDEHGIPVDANGNIVGHNAGLGDYVDLAQTGAAMALWWAARQVIDPMIDRFPHSRNLGGLMQGSMRFARDKVGEAWVTREDQRLDAEKMMGYGDTGVLPRGPGIWGLYDPLAAVVSRIVAAGRGSITGWGWRSTERQAQLYAAWKAGVPGQAKAAPPGKSNHERGAAVDWSGNLGLARQLSRQHGLIQPMSYEPWHWEHPRQGKGRGGPVGSGVGRWRPTFLQALSAAGKPAGWVNSGLRRMQQESGGNPQAINNWDSNARRGTPSKGLMQVIDPTFRAYAGPMLGRGIWDPLANIYASIQYATRRYGSAPRGWDRPGGYADGAWRIPHNELAFLHRDEMVIPPGEAEGFRAGMQRAGADSVKGRDLPPIVQNFHGLTDPAQQARATGDEVAWRLRVGAG